MSRGKWSQVAVRVKAKGRVVPFEFIKGTGEKAQGVVTDENQRSGPSWVLLTVNPDFGGVPASNPTLEFSPVSCQETIQPGLEYLQKWGAHSLFVFFTKLSLFSPLHMCSLLLLLPP